MRRLTLAVLGTAGVVSAACGDDAETIVEPAPPVVEMPAPPTPVREEIFGTDGQLMESAVVIAGLRLPRGLTVELDQDRTHIFTTTVALPKLLAYFGPRLETAEVDRFGATAVYRAAAPRDAQGGVVRMDVTLLPYTNDSTRVTIEELPPPSGLSPEELEAQLARDQEHWD
jgi:hypothetical protein